jgi:16S rRNA (adenine1518-N6/adenine1519-N6)-dimethyltransferase
MNAGAGPGEGASRPSFGDYRARLEAVGFRPRRRFGQNFLLDQSLHRVIVDAAALDDRTVVLEIGVGLGFLTRELAASPCVRIVAAEIDDRLADIVAEDAPSWSGGGKVELVRGDALGRDGDLAEGIRVAVGSPERLAVVANLPYATSGPLLAALATTERPPDTIVALVQLELAERLVAGPGEREGGGLGILVQRGYDVALVRRVGRDVFRPRPNVDSAIVRMTAREAIAHWPDVSVRRRFAAWLRGLFAQRRKTLPNAIRSARRQLGLEPTAPATGPDGGGDRRRPEELDPAEHWRLFVDQVGVDDPGALGS